MLSLDLSHTRITDVGTRASGRLPRLNQLKISGTDVTRGGILRFRKANPRVSLVGPNRRQLTSRPEVADASLRCILDEIPLRTGSMTRCSRSLAGRRGAFLCLDALRETVSLSPSSAGCIAKTHCIPCAYPKGASLRRTLLATRRRPPGSSGGLVGARRWSTGRAVGSLYRRRGKTVEPFFGHVKEVFGWAEHLWHAGLGNNRTLVLAALLLLYQILLVYDRVKGRDDAEVKWILDLL